MKRAFHCPLCDGEEEPTYYEVERNLPSSSYPKVSYACFFLPLLLFSFFHSSALFATDMTNHGIMAGTSRARAYGFRYKCIFSDLSLCCTHPLREVFYAVYCACLHGGFTVNALYYTWLILF